MSDTKYAAAKRQRGRPRSFDLDVALDRAVEVFWCRGYNGAGLAELTAAMGISPPSLYAAFGDKRGLFLAAMERYLATAGAGPRRALESARTDKIRAFLDATVELAFSEGEARGCFVACVAVDAAGDDPMIRDRVRAVMQGSETALAAAAGPDGPSGSVLLAAMHAVAVRARAGEDRDGVTRVARDLEAALCPDTARR